MKVLAVASSGRLGGAELALAEFLHRRPPDVAATALLVGDGPLRERLHALGLEVWTAGGYEGRPTAIGVGRFTRSLLRLLEQTTPDVVWATGLKAASLAVPACRLIGIPLVWHKVDFSLDAVLTRPLGAAVSGVVSVSEAVAQALGPLRGSRLVGVVGPPIRLPDDLHLTPYSSPPTIGTLAALTPYKGQHHIVEAAAMLSEEFPQLRVLLAGAATADDPDYPQRLRGLIERLGLADRVQLTGFVDDVTEVLRRLTVFVNATYRDAAGYGMEGLSTAMLEASWAGLPVVATRGGGTPEGLRDGGTGTLVTPADPAEMAAAIAPYLRDGELALSTGEAGRRYTRERFAPEVTAARLFDALAKVADRRG